MEILNTQYVLRIPVNLVARGGDSLAEGRLVVIAKKDKQSPYQCWSQEGTI